MEQLEQNRENNGKNWKLRMFLSDDLKIIRYFQVVHMQCIFIVPKKQTITYTCF